MRSSVKTMKKKTSFLKHLDNQKKTILQAKNQVVAHNLLSPKMIMIWKAICKIDPIPKVLVNLRINQICILGLSKNLIGQRMFPHPVTIT